MTDHKCTNNVSAQISCLTVDIKKKHHCNKIHNCVSNPHPLSLPPWQVQKLRGMVEQQRFLRLQHLLKQSNIYSKFLLKRMEEQRQRQEEDQKKKLKTQRKKRVQTKQVSEEGLRYRLQSPSLPCGGTCSLCNRHFSLHIGGNCPLNVAVNSDLV